MKARWMSALVRARQVQEDAAQQTVAAARRRVATARCTAQTHGRRIDDLGAGLDGECPAPQFIGAAVAVQSAAAAHAAMVWAVQQAEAELSAEQDRLRKAAVAREAAERLVERADEADRELAERSAQRELDETAVRTFRFTVPDVRVPS